MNYSDSLKINWITPTRTGTRSCIKVQNFYNFNIFGTHDINLTEYRKDYQLIFNIRNPYSRIVSLYHLWLIHNPTKKPPKARIKKPFKENIFSKLKSSIGCIPVGC